MTFSRACFLSSERTTYHGAHGVSVLQTSRPGRGNNHTNGHMT